MDVLTAHTPRGFLHAVTCDWPTGAHHGERFRAIQEHQGCTVRRYPMEAYLAQQAQGRLAGETLPALPDATSPRHPEPTPDLPALGQAIVHPVIGYAVVSHLIGPQGARQPVASGPRGQGLVHPGEWRAATDADRPVWMRPDDVMPEAPTTQHVPSSNPDAAPMPAPVPYSPHAWIQGPVWSVQQPQWSVLGPIWSASPVQQPAPAASQPPTAAAASSVDPPAVAVKSSRMPTLFGTDT